VLDADAANTAVMPANTTLDIVLDPSFTINDFACNLPFHELAGAGPNNKKINLDNELVPGVTVIAVLHATPSTDGPYHAHVTFDDLGGCGGIKTRDLDEVSFCSCDPNDLEVDPAGCGENHEVTGDARFTYRVRFENIGEGAAHNIVVRDVIDPALDTSTLRVITSSHKVTSWQVGPNNELVVRFDNINLAGTIGPGRNTGFVMFKADPLPNLPVGTVIHNSADVTFDYNSPLATNVVSNKIVAHPCEVVAVKPAVLSTYLGQNYPNPFNPSTTISMD
jgi:hypothetical protein